MFEILRQAKTFLTWGVFVLFFALPGHCAEYFVAPTGDDGGPGSQDRPFRTIAKAAEILGPGDVCYVRAGVYREVVRPKRSGREGRPVRFQAWPGEIAVLCGTEPIRGDWSVYKGKIYKTRVGRAFDQLFVDGKLMTEARWPNMPLGRRFDKSAWAVAGAGSEYGLMVDPALASTDVDWTGAVATLNVGSWQTWRRIVRGHSPGGDRFRYDKDLSGRLASKRQWEGFDHYYLSGKLEALDAPGEWHLDRGSGTLYLRTGEGDSPARHRVEAKVRDYVFTAKRQSHVELVGFHFFGASFAFDRCDRCVVDGCHLRYPICGHGLEAAPPTLVSGEGNVVRNCSVVFADGPGISMGGSHNTLENCLIHDCDWNAVGRSLGVSMAASDASVVRRCTVFNVGSSEGLRVPVTGPSLVEYNYVHHAGLVQSDGALIQSGSIHVAGTVIRYNWVHDHNAFNWGGIGIRGDDLTRKLLVHHNVAWNCREKGIIVKGDHNRVFNNTCLNNAKIDILAPSRPEPFKSWAPGQHPFLLKRQNADTQIANNLAPVISGTFTWQSAAAPPLGPVENNYTGQTPMLVDPARRDFRPLPDSPLVDAGKPIAGITDGHQGKAPDIGAYEAGRPPWLPGCRSRLWVGAPEKQADGTFRLGVVLQMPPTEPVRLVVTACAPGGKPARAETKTLAFTPDDWAQRRTVVFAGQSPPRSLRFCDRHLGQAAVGDLRAIDARLGKTIRFDRPMLPTRRAAMPPDFASQKG